MKKGVSLYILLAIMVLNASLVGCSNEQPADTGVKESSNSAESETSESQGIEVDKKILSVDVTLPASIVGDSTDFNEEEYVSGNDGVSAAKLNNDGSVTLTMTKAKHRELLDETRKSLDETFGELIEGEDTPYIKSIDYTNDYREVIVGVIKDEYENAFDLTPFLIGVTTGMYQSIAGIDYQTTVVINDASTGKEIHSVTYPDAWEE